MTDQPDPTPSWRDLLAEPDLVDSNGYPVEEILNAIPALTATPRELVEDILRPIFDVYGGVKVERIKDFWDRPVVKVSLVTGGWSGCESAVSALERSLFWFAWWQSSSRGGSFTFEVPEKSWDEPMVEWPQHPTAYERGYQDGLTAARAAPTKVYEIEIDGSSRDLGLHATVEAAQAAAQAYVDDLHEQLADDDPDEYEPFVETLDWKPGDGTGEDAWPGPRSFRRNPEMVANFTKPVAFALFSEHRPMNIWEREVHA